MTQPETETEFRERGTHSPIHRDQALWERVAGSGALECILDTGHYGGRTVFEAFVESDSNATFTVYGSVDGTTWREKNSISVPGSGGTNVIGGFNAYQFVRVATADAGNHTIEIATSR